MTIRCITCLCVLSALLLTGCAGNGKPKSVVPAYVGEARPAAEVATIREADGMWIHGIDDLPFKGEDQGVVFPLGPQYHTYSVLPGKRTLIVKFWRQSGHGAMFSRNIRVLEFNAEPGQTYKLDGKFAMVSPMSLRDQDWTPRVLDKSGRVVAEAPAAN